jgi:hypothetical protein
MNISEFKNKILEICPEAQFETDNSGQIVIYTNKRTLKDGYVVDYDNAEAIYEPPY